MPFKRVNEEQCVCIDIQIRLRSICLADVSRSVQYLARGVRFFLNDHALLFINFEPWVDTQDCWIRVGIRRQPIKLKAVRFISDTSRQRLELVVLQRSCLITLAVEKLDDDTVFLDIGDAKPVVQERRAQRGSLRERIEFLHQRGLTHAKGHTSTSVVSGKIVWVWSVSAALWTSIRTSSSDSTAFVVPAQPMTRCRAHRRILND